MFSYFYIASNAITLHIRFCTALLGKGEGRSYLEGGEASL